MKVFKIILEVIREIIPLAGPLAKNIKTIWNSPYKSKNKRNWKIVVEIIREIIPMCGHLFEIIKKRNKEKWV